MKTNKSLTKRIKITKTGKLLARTPGQNHFNAKAKRTKQLSARKMQAVRMSNKERSRFLPGT